MNPPQKTVAIYARVSTDKQAVDMQLSELRDFVKRSNWKIYKKYIDQGYTGANTKRPAFTDMMNQARKRKFDILLIWKLDSLSRSLKDLINTLDELGHLGVDFISYDNNLDTSTPTGKLVFQFVGAVAEFEKDIIRERVKAGLENAKRPLFMIPVEAGLPSPADDYIEGELDLNKHLIKHPAATFFCEGCGRFHGQGRNTSRRYTDRGSCHRTC